VATSSTGKKVVDEVEFEYQTAKWSAPVVLKLASIAQDAKTVTVEATLHDAAGLLCLDAKTLVRFSVAGPGKMMDNLGTTTGSRQLQMYNGRAQITVARGGGANTVAVVAEGVAAGSLVVA